MTINIRKPIIDYIKKTGTPMEGIRTPYREILTFVFYFNLSIDASSFVLTTPLFGIWWAFSWSRNYDLLDTEWRGLKFHLFPTSWIFRIKSGSLMFKKEWNHVSRRHVLDDPCYLRS